MQIKCEVCGKQRNVECGVTVCDECMAIQLEKEAQMFQTVTLSMGVREELEAEIESELNEQEPNASSIVDIMVEKLGVEL